jgi:zinc/manganese transport system permease protein
VIVYDVFIAPFAQSPELLRALVGSSILAISAGPIGVFLMLRRMSLTGDAMSHAILPGVAASFLLTGLAVIPMTLGGIAAGLIVALLSGVVSRATKQYEDTTLAAFYLISLAAGVMLVSLRGTELDLEHVLFGEVLKLGTDSLLVIAIAASATLLGFALIWRPLMAECLDPAFLRSVSKAGQPAHLIFLVLVVLNLVAGYQAFGALLAVGLMMLPAAAARFWARSLEAILVVAIGLGLLSAAAGLWLADRLAIDSGPTVVLIAGAIYVVSIVAGRHGLLLGRLRSSRHRVA